MLIRKLTGIWDKTIGLSFKKKVEPVWFETRWGIHTFFVSVPLDIFICDNDFVVRKIKRNLKPWSIFVWNPKYKNVIEVPLDISKNQPLKVGDKITLKYKIENHS